MLNLDNVDKDFICPITRKIMLNPVIDSLGASYEKEAIENWFNSCKQNNQPLTSWDGKETQEDDRVILARNLKPKITKYLEENAQYWSEVYLSKKLCDEFAIAFEKKEKQKLMELIKTEQRFLTFNNCALISWVIKENDLPFLKDIVIPNLSYRGQQKYFFNVLASCAEAKWIEGMRLLIASEKWGETHFQQCIIKWIQENKPQAVKALLHEMQSQKFNINAVDENGNTFIHVATVAGHAELVTLLLAMGLDSAAKNGEGLSAEALAAKNNHPAVVEAFKKFYASGQQASGSNPQIQMLQNEVQELKYQIAKLENQTKQDVKQLHNFSEIVKCAGVPFFTSLKNKSVKHGFFIEKPTLTLTAEQDIINLILLPDEQVLTVGKKGKLTTWDINEGNCVKITLIETSGKDIAKGDNFVLNKLDGQFVTFMSANEDSIISGQLWDSTSLTCINTVRFDVKELHLLRWTKNLQEQIKRSGKELQIISNKNAKPAFRCAGHKEDVIGVTQLGNGNLISYSKDKTLKIWDIEKGECITTLSGHSGEIARVIELPNNQIASITQNGEGIIWDISTKAEGKCVKKFSVSGYNCLHEFNAITEGILAIVCSSPNNKYTKLYDLNIDKEMLITADNHYTIDKLPNGMMLAYPADTSGMKLLAKFNYRWECIQTFAKGEKIDSVVVLDDLRVVTASGTTLKVWDNPVRRQTMQAEKEIANIIPGCRIQ